MGAQYDLSSKVNSCNKPPADHSSCHAYTAPVGTPHEVRPSLRQSCNTKLFRIDQNYWKLGSKETTHATPFALKHPFWIFFSIHTECHPVHLLLLVQLALCGWNRVRELSPTSGESAEARALQGEHLKTHGATRSYHDVNQLVDVVLCLVMLSPPRSRI